MLVLHADITVVAGGEAAFESAAHALAAASVANESGLRRYEYVRLSEPGRYLAIMAFTDHEAFIEHQASEHHYVIAGQMRELIVEIRLERVDPIVGPMAETGVLEPPRIEPADAASLEARRASYRQRYPFDAATWWGEIG